MMMAQSTCKTSYNQILYSPQEDALFAAMCSRINQHEISAAELMERYNIPHIDDDLQLPFDINIGVGAQALVVLEKDGINRLEKAVFGFTPSWSKKRTSYFNARLEGSDNNTDNDSNYSGPYGILQSGAFKSAFMKRRCLVPVRSFIEGPEKEKLSEPYLVYSHSAPLFSLAGIYEHWTNPADGETVLTFAILTRAACPAVQAIRHHRMPVPVSAYNEQNWLTPLGADELIAMCTHETLSDTWQTYALNHELVKSGRLHDAALLKAYTPPSNTLF